MSASSLQVPEIDVEELKRALDAREDVLVLDVREPHEWQRCNIGGLHIPLRELPQRVQELDRTRDLAVLCRSGVRSASAVRYLRGLGFDRARNVAGGILAWADRVDPAVPKY